MKTVKEIAKLTGISVRTLHYYDEIGLLKPSLKNEAGYRLYDDKALEKLQQILFFREFDISLREIRNIMENPDLDQNQILQMQRNMLVIKKKRFERLIASIDAILKGESHMDFKIFDKHEIEELYLSMVANMSEDQKAVFTEQHGSMENFQKYFMENALSEEAQKNFEKIVEWYGSREKALESSKSPQNPELFPAWQKRIGDIYHKLAAKKDCDVHSFEVRELIGEYDFVSKQLYQMEDVSKLLLELAAAYRANRQMQEVQDSIYGKGSTEFIGRAIEAFYK